VYPFTVSK